MKTFDFAPGISLRVIEKDGEPWFVAKDVCDALDMPGYASNHVKHLDEDERCTISRATDMRDAVKLFDHKAPTATLISEPGFYSLIGRSRKPEAKTFKRWVTHEVLPTIRKTGGYMVPSVAVKVAENPMEAIARGLVDSVHLMNEPSSLGV